jgi:hypothetical protein
MKYRWAYPYAILCALEEGGGWRTLLEFVRRERKTVSDLWLTDPMPILAETLYLGLRAFGLYSKKTGMHMKKSSKA